MSETKENRMTLVNVNEVISQVSVRTQDYLEIFVR